MRAPEAPPCTLPGTGKRAHTGQAKHTTNLHQAVFVGALQGALGDIQAGAIARHLDSGDVNRGSLAVGDADVLGGDDLIELVRGEAVPIHARKPGAANRSVRVEATPKYKQCRVVVVVVVRLWGENVGTVGYSGGVEGAQPERVRLRAHTDRHEQPAASRKTYASL